jgi:hypothetical protein
MGEIQRRKFTAEEGDHLTLLNGEPCERRSSVLGAALKWKCSV